MELAGALFWFWTKCGLFGEGRRWLERALALPVHVPGSVFFMPPPGDTPVVVSTILDIRAA